MTLSDFSNKTLGRQFAAYKWARNNTLQLLKAAQLADVYNFTTHSEQYSVFYQFQCLVTGDDAYYRKLTNNSNQQFGIALIDDAPIKKEDLTEAQVIQLLTSHLVRLETLLASYSDTDFERDAQDIQRIFNHEYLHQGQLVVLFRAANVPLPERFKDAFAL